jgi:hypothetical protein
MCSPPVGTSPCSYTMASALTPPSSSFWRWNDPCQRGGVGVPIIDRSSVNAFDDPAVAQAITAAGRKKLISRASPLKSRRDGALFAGHPSTRRVRSLTDRETVDLQRVIRKTKGHALDLWKEGCRAGEGYPSRPDPQATMAMVQRLLRGGVWIAGQYSKIVALKCMQASTNASDVLDAGQSATRAKA